MTRESLGASSLGVNSFGGAPPPSLQSSGLSEPPFGGASLAVKSLGCIPWGCHHTVCVGLEGGSVGEREREREGRDPHRPYAIVGVMSKVFKAEAEEGLGFRV